MKKKLLIRLFLFLFLIIIVIYPHTVNAISLDGIMSGADNFLSAGGTSFSMSDDQLTNTSDFLYNILLGICMVIAVVVGMVLGIKYMVASAEDKAEIKQTLIPYVVACAITFGAFTIWKIVINIIQ